MPRFVKFSLDSGKPISINLDHVLFISPGEPHKQSHAPRTLLHMDGDRVFSVEGEYERVLQDAQK